MLVQMCAGKKKRRREGEIKKGWHEKGGGKGVGRLVATLKQMKAKITFFFQF